MSRPRGFSSRARIAFVAGGIALSAFLAVLAFGFYPIVIVNGSPVWASSFRSYLASAVSYQQTARETYGASATSTPLITALEEGDGALGALALDDLVGQRLVDQGLEDLVGDNAYRLVSVKLAAYSENPQLAGASRALFQLDPQAFTSAILAPQAAREVLAGRLFIDRKTVEDWSLDRRKASRVRVLSSSYRWDGERITAR